ncbi:Uncharacterised protein [Candidatus Tiddalikarchaeum anstoanum]|nr:Uncharacterised protein [Candidatus Tiddalikarchaeum anstoanum]
MKTLHLIILILLFSGCTVNPKYVTDCVSLCTAAKNAGLDFSNGPCLSNDYYPDYVCDVAHNPRISIDNLVENQCSAFGVNASHFVEVDASCSVISVV